jgi:hypothetical protein
MPGTGWLEVDKEDISRIEQLEIEVEALRKKVSVLSDSIRDLLESEGRFRHPIDAILTQRGLPILSRSLDNRFLPLPNIPMQKRDEFYRMMRRYSFRLFLRDLIQFPEGMDIVPLTRYCSTGTAMAYLNHLESMGIVALGSGPFYRFLPKHIVSFGPTLEWYVSEIFQREFLAPSLFNLRLERTRFGGDYDVMAVVSGQLIYVEVKSSPPRGVELPAVHAFINRLCDLQPEMAIFLVDTELRMRDKMVPLFDESLQAHRAGGPPWAIERIAGEIFQIGHTVFITNSRKGIYSNLRTCIRHGFHHRSSAKLPVRPCEDQELGR